MEKDRTTESLVDAQYRGFCRRRLTQKNSVLSQKFVHLSTKWLREYGSQTTHQPSITRRRLFSVCTHYFFFSPGTAEVSAVIPRTTETCSRLVSAVLGRSRPFPAVLGICKYILKRSDQRFVDETLICVELVFKSVPRWGCPAKARRSTLVMIPSF